MSRNGSIIERDDDNDDKGIGIGEMRKQKKKVEVSRLKRLASSILSTKSSKLDLGGCGVLIT